jgi:hypothetical protein
MNLAHQNGHHFLIHTTRDDLIGISNALNEVCHGIHIPDSEFETRLGCSRADLKTLLDGVSSFLASTPSDIDSVATWSDGCSVQARCVSACGDPVDMSSAEARDFAGRLVAAADEADAN